MLQENRAGAFSFNQDFRRGRVLSARKRGAEGGGGGEGRGGVRGIQAGAQAEGTVGGNMQACEHMAHVNVLLGRNWVQMCPLCCTKEFGFIPKGSEDLLKGISQRKS